MREFIVSEDFHPEVKYYPDLIRCKDCKHGYPLTDSAYYACTKPFAEPNNRKPFDWFCADGERKDGDK